MSLEKKAGSAVTSEFDGDEIVSRVPKEAFKAMFYMYAGKPDSIVKMFEKKIIVTVDDIIDLNRRVVGKLKLHNIDQCVSTANVKFDKGESVSFGTWVEFETHDWKVARITGEVSVRWDFMIQLAGYKQTQRHTLTVRLSASPRPIDILQSVLMKDPDEDIDIESKWAMCIARVDFISHLLGDELIDVVARWNESLSQPHVQKGWFSWVKKNFHYFAPLVRFSIPVGISTVLLSYLDVLFHVDHNAVVRVGDLLCMGRWLLVSAVAIYFSARFAYYLAGKCYMSVNEYGAVMPFLLTRGDENYAREAQLKNKSKIKSFFFNIGVAFIVNVVAGVVTWCILKGA